MSENTNPNAGEGQQTQTAGEQSQPTTPDAGGTQAGDQDQQPFRTFSSQDDLNSFMQERVTRAGTSALNDAAQAAGFENWEQMQGQVTAIRQAVNPNQGTEPGTEQPTGGDDAAQLRMALQVGQEKNLPAALIGRLQGGTLEEMQADADALLALVQPNTPTSPAGPGIPSVPNGQQPVTFTRTQLQDPEFVRQNADAIRQAATEGRIVDS